MKIKTDIIKRTKSAPRLCSDGRIRMIPRPRTLVESCEIFWRQVKKTSTCWIWTGFKKDNGNGLFYGVFWNNRKIIKAHRFAWIVLKGEIPEKKLVCHRCDNPLCVKPSHLFLGTYLDNNQDAVHKGRHAVGNQMPNAILNPKKVRLIRSLLKEGFSQSQIANKVGCGVTTAQAVIDGRSWKHVK